MSDPDPRSRRRPKRSLGQNFLVDDRAARRIVAALEAGPDDEVLEIGSGRGALSRHLAGSVRRLTLVELDDELAAELGREHEGSDDVRVVHSDFLELDWSRHVEDAARVHVVGNIPYNITSPILFKLLERPRPTVIVLMVQAEVARRIVAPPGSRAYGALTVGVRSVAESELLFDVGRRAFRPMPRVDSSVLRIRPTRPEPLTAEEEVGLRTLVRALFQWRRKQLGKILRDHPDLGVPRDRLEEIADGLGIDLGDRPERLAPTDFLRLSRALPHR